MAGRDDASTKAIRRTAERFKVDIQLVEKTFPGAKTSFYAELARHAKSSNISWTVFSSAVAQEAETIRKIKRSGPKGEWTVPMVKAAIERIDMHPAPDETKLSNTALNKNVRLVSGVKRTIAEATYDDTEENDKDIEPKRIVKIKVPTHMLASALASDTNMLEEEELKCTLETFSAASPVEFPNDESPVGFLVDSTAGSPVEFSTTSPEPECEEDSPEEAGQVAYAATPDLKNLSTAEPLAISLDFSPEPDHHTDADSTYKSCVMSKKESLDRLNTGMWLNDEVINDMLRLLANLAGSSQLHTLSSGTFSFGRLSTKIYRGKTIMKPLQVDIMIHSKLTKHWVLAVIPPRRDSSSRDHALVLDSLPGWNAKEVASVQVQSLFEGCCGKKLSDSHILFSSPMTQDNGFDCGIITVLHGWCVATGMAYPNGQPDSKTWREAFRTILEPLSEAEIEIIMGSDHLQIDSDSLHAQDENEPYVPHISSVSLYDPKAIENLAHKLYSDVRDRVLEEQEKFPPMYLQQTNLVPTKDWVTPLVERKIPDEAVGKQKTDMREAMVRFLRLSHYIQRQDAKLSRLDETLQALEQQLQKMVKP